MEHDVAVSLLRKNLSNLDIDVDIIDAIDVVFK